MDCFTVPHGRHRIKLKMNYCQKMIKDYKAKVAVIIPAYNASRTLSNSVKSLMQQTLKDLQIIIVNDGSTDNTSDIARYFADEDSRILVLDKSNGGAYSARRYALDYVNAEYVGFMDADDKNKPEMYEHMYNFAKAHNLEVVRCDTVSVNYQYRENEVYTNRKQVYDNILYSMLIEGVGYPTVWDHIYKVPNDGFNLVESNIMMGDDMVINLQFLKDITTYGWLHEPLYYYQINDGSSVRNYKPKNVDDFQENIRFRKKILKSWYNVEFTDDISRMWVIKNLYNNFVVAATANAPSWSYRINNIHRLLNIPECRDNIDYFNNNGGLTSNLIVMKYAYTKFLTVIILVLQIKKKLF